MRLTSLTLCGLFTISTLALAQEPGPRRYFPLHTPLPPTGRAGDWAGRLGKGSPIKFQQVQVQLPFEGVVTWYDGGPQRPVAQQAPSMAGLLVGPVYRLKLSDLADLPGVELYPTVEMLDRLHPPVGRETQFPVIIPFTEEELLAARQGSLVVKVIYLEQPNRASPVAAERGKAIPAIRISPRDNPIEVADVHGRPLAIVRMGGRVPDAKQPEPGFFGSGAPLQLSKATPVVEDVISVPQPSPRGPRKPTPPVIVPAPDVQPAPEADVETEPVTPKNPIPGTKPRNAVPAAPEPAAESQAEPGAATEESPAEPKVPGVDKPEESPAAANDAVPALEPAEEPTLETPEPDPKPAPPAKASDFE